MKTKQSTFTLQEWIETLVLNFVEWTELTGHLLLIVTIPLGIVQGVFSIFPFATLFFLHVSTFGMKQGFLLSWLIGSLASLVSFVLSRYLFLS